MKEDWASAPVCGSPMRVVTCKLKHMRVVLRNWNFDLFRDLNRRIEDCSIKLEVI